MVTRLRWSELVTLLPYEARAALTTALDNGLRYAQTASALVDDDCDVTATAERLDAALECFAQARELLTLTLHLACERQDASPSAGPNDGDTA